MPKKLQIKALSSSGELLTITNCSVGRVSVLRSESPAELRPYQRALSGAPSSERFIITVDGDDFHPEKHNVLGFGELPLHSGVTVTQFLAEAGLAEGAIAGLLVSFGLEGCESKLCGSLSPDEDRKVRLFAATADASKVLILNEPFEPIASSWRERIADFLADFARTKDGLVIITSLSYRPDAWIDNPTIARHQVGLSLRRTIGFGAGDSETTQLMNEIRDKVRQDTPVATEPHAREASKERAAAASLAVGAITTSSVNLSPNDPRIWEESVPSSSWWQTFATLTALKVGTALTASVVGVWVAVSAYHRPAEPPKPHIVASNNGQPASKPDAVKTGPIEPEQKAAPPVNVEPAKIVGRKIESVSQTALLDGYPESIRISLIDTSRGIMGDPNEETAPQPVAAEANPQSQNFYQLLQEASTEKGDTGGGGDSFPGEYYPPAEAPPEMAFEESPEEEERREEIRQRFLDAIREASERQEQAAAEG